MLTLCWAAKGGSGTTVVTAALALLADRPTLVVDLDGDLPIVLGLGADARPGVHDWLRSSADGERLSGLAVDVTPTARMIPVGATDPAPDPSRWHDLATALADRPEDVIVDAGGGEPPVALAVAAERRLLVTRPCSLSLRAATPVDEEPAAQATAEPAADDEPAAASPVTVSDVGPAKPAIPVQPEAPRIVPRRVKPSGGARRARPEALRA